MLGTIIKFCLLTCLTVFALFWLFTSIIVLTPEQWHLLGDIARNTSALAVLAASTAAYIAWGTNRTRTKEATRSDFKDRIHWAATHFTGDPTLTSLAAEKIIDQFATDGALGPSDLALAVALSEQKEKISASWQAKVDELQNYLTNQSERVSQLLKIINELKLVEALDEKERAGYFAELAQLNLQLKLSADADKAIMTLRDMQEQQEALEKIIEVLEDVAIERRGHEQ